MKHAIVTGATGFIGKAVVSELIENQVTVYAVVRPDSPNIAGLPKSPDLHLIPCSLQEIGRLKELMAGQKAEVCYHFAWEGVSGPKAADYRIQLSNVQALLELTDQLTELGVRKFISPGSMHEVESLIEMEKNEVAKNMGMMYKGAKLAAHHMAKANVCRQDIDFLWPVVSNAYGVGEVSARLINSTIRKLLQGESPDFTKGDQYYDFIYITDVAKAFRHIGERGKTCRPYVIGSGHSKPLRQFLEQVGHLVAPDIPLHFGAHPFQGIHVPQAYYDDNMALLSADTGFFPEVSFQDGILKLTDWIKEETAGV